MHYLLTLLKAQGGLSKTTTYCLINVSLSEEKVDPKCYKLQRNTGGIYVCGSLSLDQESRLPELSVSDPHKSAYILSSGIIHVSTNRAEALIKCLLPFMLSTSLQRSRHSRVGRSIASATTVSSEEHFHRMRWPLKRFESVLAEWTLLAACLDNPQCND